MGATDEARTGSESFPSGGADVRRSPDRHPAARARAYLDLWERNLVHAAVQGRVMPARSEDPAV